MTDWIGAPMNAYHILLYITFFMLLRALRRAQ